MKSTTVQEIGMANKVHLCDSCKHEVPTCDSDNLIFGSGKGNDNVVACSTYQALTYKEKQS